MQPTPFGDQIFLDKLKEKIEANLSSESFGVSELADEVGMSRSNLLRKVKKITGQSVSQFIREVRLERAMLILREGSMNVSEVSDAVGFGSVSYFVKCFREKHGYPPGEVAQQQEEVVHEASTSKPEMRNTLLIVGGIFLVLFCSYLIFGEKTDSSDTLEKSIAVLPFKNDSNDSSNVYLINGLMESTLTNLQKIGNLRVLSRTSSEKYRNSPKSIPEIADELEVNYFVEGSGQKIGDRIMLNIQLIEASSDKNLWSIQYERDTKDIFNLQQEIASNIANEIRAIITPKERRQITKIPTNSLLAYDNYLKGQDLAKYGERETLYEAIPYFKKAVELDNSFAAAYASLAVCYYYLDLFQSKKEYSDDLKEVAEKAMEIDSDIPDSNVAMALYERDRNNHAGAVPYLEKALELNPNSAEVINMLSDTYANYIPNTEKYLEYALKGIQVSKVASDSITTSYIYLHLSNALIQSGFIEESIFYVNRSLDYNKNNGFSNYVKAFMLFARDKDKEALRSRLITEWEKDSTRLDILQEIGKVNFFMRDYDSAYYYYDILLKVRKQNNLDAFRYENLKIGIVYEKLGKEEKAEELIADYYDYAIQDESYYRELFLSVYYAYYGDAEKSNEHLRKFAEGDNYQYWLILFDDDPATDPIDGNKESAALWKSILDKFWEKHEKLRKDLEAQGLI